ncbi:MAG: hypothetical protein ACYCZO_05880 [Daejeonella sp.]
MGGTGQTHHKLINGALIGSFPDEDPGSPDPGGLRPGWRSSHRVRNLNESLYKKDRV